MPNYQRVTDNQRVPLEQNQRFQGNLFTGTSTVDDRRVGQSAEVGQP